MTKAKMTQKSRMLNFMADGRMLSPKQARTLFSVAKPSARICELRDDGHEIISTKNTKNRFAYQLITE